jgi:hypothetical protein
MTTNMPTSIDLVSVPDFGDALAKLLPEASKIPEAECLAINTDVGEAGGTALWAATRMETLRDALVARFPDYVVHLDGIVPAAQAVLQAQFNHSAAMTPPEAIPELEAKLVRMRAMLLADVQGLVLRGLLAQKDVPEMGTANAHRNLAFGTGALVALLRNNWDRVKSRTAVTEEELDEAQEAAQRLAVAVVVRERGESALGATAVIRRQLFTLLIRRYEFLRQAFAFLRWFDGDADKFAPSLYVNQRSRRKPEAETADSASPATGAQANGQGFGGSVPTVTTTTTTTNPAAKRIPDGLPGSSPTD